MIVFRLSKKKYCTDLSGKGAEMAGGRWNSKGIAMLYTSQSRALCLAEMAVNIPLGVVPIDYYLVEIEIPDSAEVFQVNPEKLSSKWNSFPHSLETQKIGDKFINEQKTLILKVPSAVVQGDFNYLINPKHVNFNKVKIVHKESFSFDKRLIR